MSFRRHERYEPAPRATRPQAVSGITSPDGPPNVVDFSHDDTYWHRRICLFLAERPDATLFGIVQRLWPDFLAMPANRRAQTWFWAKDQLERLRAARILQSREAADGVALWSLAPARPR